MYNGSVHYWHVVRPLQCDKLRHHLLPSQDKLCQVGAVSSMSKHKSNPGKPSYTEWQNWHAAFGISCSAGQQQVSGPATNM